MKRLTKFIAWKSFIIGVFLGLVVPSILVYIDLLEVGLSVTLQNISWVVRGQKILFILCIAFPFFFAVISMLISNLRRESKEANDAYLFVDQIFNSMIDGLIIFDNQGREVKSNFVLSAICHERNPAMHTLACYDLYYQGAQLESITEDFWDSVFFPIEVKQKSTMKEFLLSRSKFLQDEKPTYIISLKNVDNLKQLEKDVLKLQHSMQESARLAALGQMAAGVAHEVNNPLSIIMLKAQLLLKKCRKSEFTSEDREVWYKDIETIMSTVDRISKIINGLRNLGRESDSEKITLTHITNVLENVLPIIRSRLTSTNVKFDVAVIPNSPKIFARPIQLSQVLINIINNAIDAVIKTESPWISMTCTMGSDERFEVRIVDSGMGIDEQIRNKIFDPFFTTKDINEGTGLGLSLSKKMMEAMNGNVRYELYQGHTCFVVEFRISTSPDSENSWTI